MVTGPYPEHTPAPVFVHLHLHTEYSLVDGLVRIKPLMQQVAAVGMPAVALTDMSNLFAMIKFYKAALSAGVKPIIGVDLWVQREQEEPGRLVLLCQNLEGYHNLTKLVSRSFQEGQQDGKALVAWSWLKEHSAGLIALSVAHSGSLGKALLSDEPKLARTILEEFKVLFPERFYIELQRTGRHEDEHHIQAAVELAALTQTPVVASNDVRFLQRTDFAAHEARVCINQGRTLADPGRPKDYSEQQYLRSAEEMCQLFADVPEAISNSVEIAKRCNLELKLGHSVLPDFPVPKGMTTDQFFTEQARQGLEQRLAFLFDPTAPDFSQQRQSYDERLQLELDVIVQMGFPGYFLIVADFIHWARENQVPVGPGRGSGAGSLVAYALGITDLDPLAYDLLFERFLNPERVSMPDFDIDFCMEGRDRVIDYVAQHYGRDRVSQIATHGTMAAKAAVRDIGRVLGHPYGFVDRVAKLIPFKPGVFITLSEALEQEAELKQLYEQDEEVTGLIDLARSVEGLARSVGKHAGGVVISPSALTDFAPLYCEPDSSSLVTQFDKDDVEAVGLVKFDFLGLRTLTIIDWAVQTINQQPHRQNQNKQKLEKLEKLEKLDITTIPLDDKKTYKLLKDCQTTAVFQLESRGMKDLVRRLQPDRFEDIVALVALFRPGPLQSGMVDDFINRKHGRAVVEYPHPDLTPILEPTYGVILYQEQVMQIAQVLASYSLGGADLLRRAMGKKKPEEMAKQREIFLAGARQRDVDVDQAGYIFDLMEKFAGYGFNKSHSAAYALVSYQTAWLKAHYPAAFMAAVLSSDMDNTDKVVIFIDECRHMKLAVVPPSVNMSQYRFAVSDQDNTIVYGLGAIKGVGESAIESIIEERRQRGEFKDLVDFCCRIDMRKVNKRVLESLIRAGAMDCLGANRATLMANLPEAVHLAEQRSRANAAGQADLFGFSEAAETPAQSTMIQVGKVTDWDEEQRLNEEKKTLGLYLTGHPIQRYQAELKHFISGCLADVLSGHSGNSHAGKNGGNNGVSRYGRAAEKPVVIAGLVVEMRTRNANRGGRMAFVTLDDRSARVEVRLFADVYEQAKELLTTDQVMVVQGAVSYDDFSESVRVTAERVLDMDQARNVYAKQLILSLDENLFANGLLDQLEGALTSYRQGDCVIKVDYSRPGAKAEMLLDSSWKIRPDEGLLRQLRGLVGEQRVQLQYR